MPPSRSAMDIETEHYKVLGLPTGAERFRLGEKEITRAYKLKALELHPDKRPDDPKAKEKFQRLQSAYEFLKQRHPQQEEAGRQRWGEDQESERGRRRKEEEEEAGRQRWEEDQESEPGRRRTEEEEARRGAAREELWERMRQEEEARRRVREVVAERVRQEAEARRRAREKELERLRKEEEARRRAHDEELERVREEHRRRAQEESERERASDDYAAGFAAYTGRMKGGRGGVQYSDFAL